MAAGRGRLEIVKALIKAGGQALVLTTNLQGASCLHSACYLGHLAIVQALIAVGWDELLLKVEAVERDYGHSCLHITSCRGPVAVVDFLLSRSCAGRLVGLQNHPCYTALPVDIAGAAGHAGVVEAIRATLCRHSAHAVSHSRRPSLVVWILLAAMGLLAALVEQWLLL